MPENEGLRQSEERFRGAMRVASIGMCLVGTDGSFLEVNPALCDLLGREESVLLVSTWQELIHPEDVDKDVALVQQVLDSERDSYRLLKRYLRPDGEIVWGDLAVSCVRSTSGEVQYFVSQINDVTRRITAEQKLAQAEQRYRLVAESAASFVALVDDQDRIIWLSPSALRLSGYSSEADLIAGGIDHVHPEDRWKIRAAAAAARSGSDMVTQDVRLRHQLGTYTWWSATTRPANDAQGPKLVMSFLDIDSEVRARHALEESEERYRWLVENMQDTLVATDHTGRITFTSPSITNLLGWGARELVGVRVPDIVHSDDREAGIAYAASLDKGSAPPITLRIVRSDGDFAWVESHGRLAKDDTGTVTGSIAVWHDATQEVQRERDLRRLAESDPLTGLPNRRELLTRLDDMLKTRRLGEHTAVLFCDVDGLKGVNDRHGHEAGDRLLREVADRIRTSLRADELVARLGGDELVIALSRVPDVDTAVRAAERTLAAVSPSIQLADGSTVTATLSIGVAIAVPDDDVQSVLERADDAMYRVKANGGNGVFAG